MKKGARKVAQRADDMRAEYEFKGGVRGKHYQALRAGYTITIRNKDGTSLVKEVRPSKGAVILEPDVRKHFPDSQAVNAALRSLIRRRSRRTGPTGRVSL